MADVRPFRALRYSLDLDLSQAICPPFDTISPELQHALHERSPYNAVHIELAYDSDGKRYERSAETLAKWRADRTLERDSSPAFYVYKQRFEHGGATYTRTTLFARLRLVPWGDGVLPHEQTFGGPKIDRLNLLQATHLNGSPVFLIYRDAAGEIARLLKRADDEAPFAMFGTEGQSHSLWGLDDENTAAAITAAFACETLYVADGHHRYETALGYRDDVHAAGSAWTGEEPENFALVALVPAGDPGLLVLPFHRVTAAAASLADAKSRLAGLFDVTPAASVDALTSQMAGDAHTFGLIAAESAEPLMLRLKDPAAVDALLPQHRSPDWRKLDYSIVNYAILRRILGLSEDQMTSYDHLWFTEDALQAERDIRSGKGRYAVLVNPVPVRSVLGVADAGERMPQKSTFFYPKVPTGLVFNLLED